MEGSVLQIRTKEAIPAFGQTEMVWKAGQRGVELSFDRGFFILSKKDDERRIYVPSANIVFAEFSLGESKKSRTK